MLDRTLSTINSLVLACCLGLIFTPVNALGIAATTVLLTTIIASLANIKQLWRFLQHHKVATLLVWLYPLVSTAIQLWRGEFGSFSAQLNLGIALTPLIAFSYSRIGLNKHALAAGVGLGALIGTLNGLNFWLDENARVRLHSTAFNTIYYGMYASMYCLIMLWMAIQLAISKRIVASVTALALCVGLASTTLAIASKGPILNLVLIACLYPIMLSKNWRWAIATGATMAVICAAGLLMVFTVFQDMPAVARFDEVFKLLAQFPNIAPENTSTGLRVQFYQLAFEAARQAPLFGFSDVEIIQLKESWLASGQATTWVTKYTHLHSDIMNALGKLGLAGLLAYLTACAVAGKLLFTTYRGNTALTLVLTAALGFFATGLFDSLLESARGIMTVLVLTSLGAGLVNQVTPAPNPVTPAKAGV
ncbi:O-antigen ligase family protein [Salinibius halmophilus]|uniref:O-antigen ligase family protein n=1 Tax=Salinibius halmophilus TaxID=1853216 RepID=UPI000E6699DD|nr:O-antigen ligase family protein [Salinibius halmophilus]